MGDENASATARLVEALAFAIDAVDGNRAAPRSQRAALASRCVRQSLPQSLPAVVAANRCRQPIAPRRRPSNPRAEETLKLLEDVEVYTIGRRSPGEVEEVDVLCGEVLSLEMGEDDWAEGFGQVEQLVDQLEGSRPRCTAVTMACGRMMHHSLRGMAFTLTGRALGRLVGEN